MTLLDDCKALAEGCEEMEHSLVHHESAKYYAKEIKERLRAIIAKNEREERSAVERERAAFVDGRHDEREKVGNLVDRRYPLPKEG